MVRDAVERSFAESGYGSGSGEGGGYGSGSSGNGSGPSMYSGAYVNLVSDPGFDGYQEGDVVIVRGSMYVDHDGDGRIDDVISIGENNNFYVGNSLAFVGFDNPMSYAQTTFRFMDDEGNLLYQTMPGAGSGYSNSYTVTADDVLNTEFISVSADVLYYDASTGFSDVLTPPWGYSLGGVSNETTGNNGYFDGSGFAPFGSYGSGSGDGYYGSGSGDGYYGSGSGDGYYGSQHMVPAVVMGIMVRAVDMVPAGDGIMVR